MTPVGSRGELPFTQFCRFFAHLPRELGKCEAEIQEIESYHIDVPNEQKYIHPKVEDQGTDGPLHLSYADPWERGLTDVFQEAEEVGLGGTVYSYTKLLFFSMGAENVRAVSGAGIICWSLFLRSQDAPSSKFLHASLDFAVLICCAVNPDVNSGNPIGSEPTFHRMSHG
jgi:hypothetical protein